jgi:2,5-dihydroxypyridine 5,6-dioxygenase
MRAQELNPAKLPILFRKELELCKIKPGNTILLLTDLKTRTDYVQAAFAAGEELGARVLELKVGAPFATGMIASFGGADAIENLPSVSNAVENSDLVLVFHVSLGAPWMQRARKKGVRFLMVLDGPDELERLMSPVGLKEAVTYTRDLIARSKELQVLSDAGTNFVAKLGELKTLCQYGFADEPGVVDTWGGAHASTWANPGSCEGTVVVQAGDCWTFPYVRYVEVPLKLTIEKGCVRKVEGEGVDARLLTRFCDGFRKHPGDMEPYAVSHLGWGMHPNSLFNQIAIHGNEMDRIHSDSRAWPGVFLFSTGPDDQGGGRNSTAAHVDFPLFGCTVKLDGCTVIERGTTVDKKMIVQPTHARSIAA